jgi:competence protein ComEC
MAPLIARRYFKKKPGLLVQTALETTSAQLMTLPLIIWTFGKVSAIALIANLLVLPAIPLAMLTTFVAGLVAMFWQTLAALIAWPARFVLSYIVDVINLLARLPWALVELEASKQQMLTMYGLLGLVTLLIFKKLQLSKYRSSRLY